jgi:hypothetical protein
VRGDVLAEISEHLTTCNCTDMYEMKFLFNTPEVEPYERQPHGTRGEGGDATHPKIVFGKLCDRLLIEAAVRDGHRIRLWDPEKAWRVQYNHNTYKVEYMVSVA